jgi:hypothetical protein
VVSSTNKTDCHDITEILLKVALNTINHKPNQIINNLYSKHTCVYITQMMKIRPTSKTANRQKVLLTADIVIRSVVHEALSYPETYELYAFGT